MTNTKKALLAATALSLFNTAAFAASNNLAIIQQAGSGNTATANQFYTGATNNKAYLTQYGVNNAGTANQAGLNGLIEIEQTTLTGQDAATRNNATASQQVGAINGLVIIKQSGNGDGGNSSTAWVNQGAGKNNQARLTQNATLATASISQDGNANRVLGVQDNGNGNAIYSDLTVTQTGAGYNYVESNQTTGFTNATIGQGAGGHHIVVNNQLGGASDLTVVQAGTKNDVRNTQAGSNGNFRTANIYQFGDRNLVNNNQDGAYNELNVLQYAGSVASSVNNIQNGANNTVNAYQFAGASNDIVTVQLGTNALFDIAQLGNNNFANLSSSGQGVLGSDKSTVTQNGHNNLAYGSQAHSNATGINTAIVVQNGNSNYAQFSQTGSTLTATINQ